MSKERLIIKVRTKKHFIGNFPVYMCKIELFISDIKKSVCVYRSSRKKAFLKAMNEIKDNKRIKKLEKMFTIC